MSFLEETYLRRISYNLRNFKAKGNHTYNFSCPICGDSHKKKSKARGYAFEKNGSLLIHCHNCNYSAGFPNFLKEVEPSIYPEFCMEKFKDTTTKTIRKELKIPPTTRKYIPNIFDGLPLVKDLDKSHPVRKYVDDRKLPLDVVDIYYAENFIEWTGGHTDKFKTWKGEDHQRIVIPFRARDSHIIGYTARAVGQIDPKYYRIFVDKDEKDKLFGIDRLDESKQVYVLEGEIDSLFIPNAIAASNGKLDTYDNKDAIYIPDADRRNPHILKNIKSMLDNGLKVCLFPENLPGKDINAFVVAGLTPEQILDIINENVYHGLSGLLKFNSWRIA